MSKAILLSIRPEWLSKILNGEKTIEVRKKFSKDYVGWVYLYCTKSTNKKYEYDYHGKRVDGKVVARFWCGKVESINYVFERYCFGEWSEEYLREKSCLTAEQLHNYLKAKTNDRNVGVAIHISKLEIFDKPKELSDFRVKCKEKEWKGWTKVLTKAPQSWCYVEGE